MGDKGWEVEDLLFDFDFFVLDLDFGFLVGCFVLRDLKFNHWDGA